MFVTLYRKAKVFILVLYPATLLAMFIRSNFSSGGFLRSHKYSTIAMSLANKDALTFLIASYIILFLSLVLLL